MSTSTPLKDYWRGYRRCNQQMDDCGIHSAKREYWYGLNGVSNAYAKGWQDALHKRIRKRDELREARWGYCHD